MDKDRKGKSKSTDSTNKSAKTGNIVLTADERSKLYLQVKLVRELLDCIFAEETQ